MRTIAIVSSKGGVGKTTFSISLAHAMTKQGSNTLLVDADLRVPNVALSLGGTNGSTIHDVISGRANLEEAIHVHTSGLRILPASHSIHNANNSDFDIFSYLHNKMLQNAQNIVIDSPPGFGEDAARVMHIADAVIAVTTPDMPSLIDTLKSIKLAKEMGKKVLGVVVNKKKKFDICTPDVAALLETTALAELPDDDSVRESLENSNPVTHMHPESHFSQQVNTIASWIVK